MPTIPLRAPHTFSALRSACPDDTLSLSVIQTSKSMSHNADTSSTHSHRRITHTTSDRDKVECLFMAVLIIYLSKRHTESLAWEGRGADTWDEQGVSESQCSTYSSLWSFRWGSHCSHPQIPPPRPRRALPRAWHNSSVFHLQITRDIWI